jgi:hypothetical protein
MSIKFAHTFDDVIYALGGTTLVAQLTGRSVQAVCNWRNRRGGVFPARLYVLMKRRLDACGVYAPDHLWDFEDEGNRDGRVGRTRLVDTQAA